MSGIRMIWIMTVEGLLNTDWLGILGVIAPPIISAWVAYQIARYQIDTQLKKQNELEVKKENRMLVTKIRLEKHELFLSTLKEYSTLESSSYFNIVNYRKGSKTIEQAENSDDALRVKVGQIEDNLSVLSLYYPKLENDVKDLFFSETLVFASINCYFADTEKCKLGKDSIHFEKLTKEHNDFKTKSKVIHSKLTTMISQIISDLENSL